MHNGYGSWDPRTDSPREKLIRGAREIGLNLIRFPGGSAANLYDWKQAIARPRTVAARSTASGVNHASQRASTASSNT
jgi:alpha-L-arabinofuranosidase